MISSVDFSNVDNESTFFDILEKLSEQYDASAIWEALGGSELEGISRNVALACADIAMCAGEGGEAFRRYEQWLEIDQGADAFLPFTRTRISAHKIIEPALPALFELVHADDYLSKLVGAGALFSLGRWTDLENICDSQHGLENLDWRLAAAVGFAKTAIYDYVNGSAFFVLALMNGCDSAAPYNGMNSSLSQAAEECAHHARKYNATSRSAELSLKRNGFRGANDATQIDLHKVDLFIKTCAKDEEFLQYCLKSIDMFVSGFRRVVIVTDEDHDYHCPLKYDHVLHKIAVPAVEATFGMPPGYRMQMVAKLSWMDFTDADAIVVTDSDTIFTGPFSPERMLSEGKPAWYYGEWHQGIVWRAASELVVGAPMPYCCMREHPFIFTRSATAGFLDYIHRRFGCSILDLFFGGMIPGKFCEFEILGGYICHISDHGYAVLEHKHLGIVKQYWSWGGITDEVKSNLEQHLADRGGVG